MDDCDQIKINIITDQNIDINSITLDQGVINHSVTHQLGGSDELLHNLLGGLQGGSSNEYYHISSEQYLNLTTGSVVRPSETGQFYPISNPSGFTTGGDLSSYATISYVSGVSGNLQLQVTNLNNTTGSYVLDSETGNFITNNQTGYFYPVSNPSGYITGAVVRPSETGNFITISQTGTFYAANNPSGFITGVDLSTYVTGDVVRPSETGIFITQSQTGVFYPISNPSGYITGINLSSYATINYTTGISGELQTQITSLNNQTGSYYPRTNPSGYITGIDLSFSGNYYTKGESESRYVNTTGTETILGDKTFHDKVYINNLYVTSLETIVNTTNTNVASNYITLNLTGGAVDGGVFFITGSGLTGINDSGAIIGFDHSDEFKFGISTRASDLSTLNTIASVEQMTGISGGLQTQISTLNNQTGGYVLKIESGQFYPISNPSGFITGIDLSSYATQSYVTGVSGQLQSQITNLNNSTGSYVLDSETGSFIITAQTGIFYAASNPSGFITGVDLSSYATTVYVTGISGGLQTQITNLSNATGSYILNSQTGQFYSISNPSGYITGIDNLIYTTGDQTISGIKNFATRPTINGTGVLLSGEGGGSTWSQNGANIYYNNGNVGIGTSTPTVSLEVTGMAIIQDDAIFNGNENTMPNQTLDAGDNSIMTRGLTKLDMLMNGPVQFSLGAASRSNTANASTSLTQGLINLLAGGAGSVAGNNSKASWDYFANIAGSGEPGMRLTTKFAISVCLNGVLNLSGASYILHVGTIGNDGLLTGVGVALKVNVNEMVLQVYDTALRTVSIPSGGIYAQGIIKLVLVWDGITKLEVYGSKDSTQPYQPPNVSLLGTLTLSSNAPFSYCSARSFDITNMINVGATESRTIRIRDIKALYTF